ncbi:RrF2 family transcriptional regulator [Novacetimonas pomaceti]|uniref:MarR family transcriptional regulator n=1 Tax=Novacetimonas pomaceti TaxID=2021998 RepID=A0ABX5P684_9PROT|nr:Rrf2 family transcriptional regulator [Novacetimonas pomaceti]PYD49314.1 hypothetical protein C3920_00060 [Novacetimonas pomaceti]
MQLSLHTDQAVKFLICMTQHSSGCASARDISDMCGLNADQVADIVHDLDRCGLIERSPDGSDGLRLRHDPAWVRVGDVIRSIEAVRMRPTPAQQPAFTEMFDLAHAAFMAALNDYSLSDIAGGAAGTANGGAVSYGTPGIGAMMPT